LEAFFRTALSTLAELANDLDDLALRAMGGLVGISEPPKSICLATCYQDSLSVISILNKYKPYS